MSLHRLAPSKHTGPSRLRFLKRCDEDVTVDCCPLKAGSSKPMSRRCASAQDSIQLGWPVTRYAWRFNCDTSRGLMESTLLSAKDWLSPLLLVRFVTTLAQYFDRSLQVLSQTLPAPPISSASSGSLQNALSTGLSRICQTSSLLPNSFLFFSSTLL